MWGAETDHRTCGTLWKKFGEKLDGRARPASVLRLRFLKESIGWQSSWKGTVVVLQYAKNLRDLGARGRDGSSCLNGGRIDDWPPCWRPGLLLVSRGNPGDDGSSSSSAMQISRLLRIAATGLLLGQWGLGVFCLFSDLPLLSRCPKVVLVFRRDLFCIFLKFWSTFGVKLRSAVNAVRTHGQTDRRIAVHYGQKYLSRGSTLSSGIVIVFSSNFVSHSSICSDQKIILRRQDRFIVGIGAHFISSYVYCGSDHLYSTSWRNTGLPPPPKCAFMTMNFSCLSLAEEFTILSQS